MKLKSPLPVPTLVICMRQKDEKTKQKELLLKACRIFRTESGDRDVHYAAAVSALGRPFYYTLEGELAKAAEQFEKALQI